MERKNANIDDVIRTVETASAKELEELAGIREAVEDLKGERVATVDPVSRVTNGAIVIHTQRLKSDPGGNLLS
ncbi:hypothetical protein LHL16_19075 [Escherichia coli]|nr:hypothetical protein [Escherichia coli]MCB4605189.1 hypothetical protein [Escherichia coli]